MKAVLKILVSVAAVMACLPCRATENFSHEYLSQLTLVDRPIENVRTLSDENASDVLHLDVTTLDVTVNAGELASAIEDKITDIDSLVVHGTINDNDFDALWGATFHGRVSVINLSDVNIESHSVPDGAFWHSEQVSTLQGVIYLTRLKHLILPNDVERIGKQAFYFGTHLTEINIPSKLKSIGYYGFGECRTLNFDKLVLPEGFESIDDSAFGYCSNLNGSLVLPSTIRRIGTGAFYGAKLTEITIPEGLETIGECAFYGCRFKDVVLPNSCVNFEGNEQFGLNYELESVTLPARMTKIPELMFNECSSLAKVVFPAEVDTVGKQAFYNCKALTDIYLNEGLKVVQRDAFYGCSSVISASFPASTEFLGINSCFGWNSCQMIYSHSVVPPTCETNENANCVPSPFGYLCMFNEKITVYVPVGSADTYSETQGWAYFVNFVETDDFPASVSDITSDVQINDNTIYDIMGRCVAKTVPGNLYIQSGKKFIAG
jgi:hypothetical protein